MTQSLEVIWADFKSAANQFPSATLRSHPVDSLTYCYLSEGPVNLFCKLVDASDKVEFLSLFSSRTNLPVANKGSVIASAEGLNFVSISTPWIDNSYAKETSTLLDAPSHILGGTIIVSGAQPGDSLTFEILHPQAGVVGIYLKNFLLPEGTSQTTIREAAKLLPAGLTLKAIYNEAKTTSSPACWGVNYTMYRADARKS